MFRDELRMTNRELNWMAGGPQGSGVDAASNIFGLACGYGGLYVYGRREYHSNIKGLHSYFHLRVASHAVAANVNIVDLLAAFDAETIVRHIDEVSNDGGIIVDKDQINTKAMSIQTLPPEFKAELQKDLEVKSVSDDLHEILANAGKRGVQIFSVPYMNLLQEIGEQIGVPQISSLTRMINILTIGISFNLLEYNLDLVERAIRRTFADKPKQVGDLNILALNKANKYAQENFSGKFNHKLEIVEKPEERIFLSGNEAVALGKVLGGCRVQTYYPITPAADESEFLEAHEIIKSRLGDQSIVVIQTEDEIAAITSASGAALAGARAATSTSGPGFSLMVEGLSWAGNSEVPVVITYYQRGAPSTGLPTRHGQADLRFAVHGGHGEFPRIVLASGDIKECFYDAITAFNYADRFQVPVIHLIDKALANSSQAYTVFDTSNVKIERGNIVTNNEAESEPYKRFKLTETGLSPRAFLGTENAVFWYTGDEHNELGHISEEPRNRNMMMEKRLKRLELIDEEIPLKEKINYYGEENPDTIIASWGSPKGAIIEAMDSLAKEGFKLGFVQIRLVHPLPRAYLADILTKAKKRIIIESNYFAQLGGMIAEQTGIAMNYQILKYTGRPMTTTEIYDALKAILHGKALERQVLTHGS